MVLTELHHRGHNHMDTGLLSKFEHKIVSSARNVKVVLSPAWRIVTAPSCSLRQDLFIPTIKNI